ncbi:hypothetical protein jhhlp_003167 [Lomentospora prolificans]|uniref:Alpha/beta hydrolase fold-3 domain-containing protein n=1 Tax=Lomentospora prolificans TaxID=41688 RepID=A0A2N3NG50_9PEZI|nr:hypothetical protein jhhlp_003167 [Lomentospora prolificans]
MNRLSTTSVSLAVMPTVIGTFFSHYLNRGPLHQKPTAHLSYHEGLNLIKAFLEFSSHHTVEELQAFTAQWVPHPQWVKVKDVNIPEEQLTRAASLLQDQLGEDGIQKVGGREWWQWRKPDTPLKAEWIEMREDYNARKKNGRLGNRIMLYVHGGAYYFGSVDEHRYQMQRHARKLKARVFAPEYRLAPQFPFPCGLQDCLAAYLYLLEKHDPSTIILAGDSAGGGMVMSLLVILRDRGIPLPAGAVLISPWVDLTHSFPSVAGENSLDYIPPAGFHHKPSMVWPPPNEAEMDALKEEARVRKAKLTTSLTDLKDGNLNVPAPEPGETQAGADASHERQKKAVSRMLTVDIDGKTVKLKDQIQMYTTNELLSHPLVSPVLQPSLGGLPPLLIMVGGGEMLRDEQIFLAHKCAKPKKYCLPPDAVTDAGKQQLEKYPPTPVQLQVWDDLCHVAPTLSFTRPAKYMYRSIAQFGAWALARAQNTAIKILDDDAISFISTGSDTEDDRPVTSEKPMTPGEHTRNPVEAVGKAGDPLPLFEDHMIRQRVTRHGTVLPLEPELELAGCILKPCDVGVVKEGPVRKWLAARDRWDSRYSRAKSKVHKQLVKEMVDGYLHFGDGETPPPSAIAGRRRSTTSWGDWGKKKTRSVGLAMWSLWGSKHDEMTMVRESKAEQEAQVPQEAREANRGDDNGETVDPDRLAVTTPGEGGGRSRSSSHRFVVDENQTGEDAAPGISREDTLVEDLLRSRRAKEAENRELLGPDYVAETGVAGKRPMVNGIAVPFSLNKDATTASMVTLYSDDEGATTPTKEVAGLDTKTAEIAQPVEGHETSNTQQDVTTKN